LGLGNSGQAEVADPAEAGLDTPVFSLLAKAIKFSCQEKKISFNYPKMPNEFLLRQELTPDVYSKAN